MSLLNQVVIPRKGWFRRLNHHDEEHILASLTAVGMLGTSR